MDISQDCNGSYVMALSGTMRYSILEWFFDLEALLRNHITDIESKKDEIHNLSDAVEHLFTCRM